MDESHDLDWVKHTIHTNVRLETFCSVQIVWYGLGVPQMGQVNKKEGGSISFMGMELPILDITIVQRISILPQRPIDFVAKGKLCIPVHRPELGPMYCNGGSRGLCGEGKSLF
ncbi:hypothetical protein PS15m_012192 [Mucor circinelloides]